MRRTHEDFDEKFGNAIRLTRIKQKLSQAELGAALAVTFQQIQKYESGANAVASTRIPDLCRALKTYPGDLFGFRSETASQTAANEHLGGADSIAGNDQKRSRRTTPDSVLTVPVGAAEQQHASPWPLARH